ncbi:HNH endonuclease [Arthrobacter sp. Soc17.1.1.1]|uniref:HNH endonuclease n=1 Tax=Arthrobacter sp. Soc17.1.1.1 TaxID=3121277 RepID=UPI003FA5EC79
MCEICSLPIDRNADPFDDRGPTADHIIPVSDGGTDDVDNLRAAHRWCNLRRESAFGSDQEVFEDARTRFLGVESDRQP